MIVLFTLLLQGKIDGYDYSPPAVKLEEPPKVPAPVKVVTTPAPKKETPKVTAAPVVTTTG
jgi:hypothetical protein